MPKRLMALVQWDLVLLKSVRLTPLAQEGNAKPRQFRLVEAEGIINRNGFNNYGIDYVVENVKKGKI